MAVNPINITRVTQNLRAEQVISSLRRTQLDLFTSQARIASGRSFVTASEDPVAASRALDLSGALGRQEQFVDNLTHADNALAAADQAITEINSLLIEAHDIASQNVGSLTSAAEREAEAELIAGIRHQLMDVGNRLFNGRYLFAGRDTTEPPFIDVLGGIAYVGDTGDLFTRTSDTEIAVTNIPGNLLFGALSSRIASDVDLTPALDPSMRLQDVLGARGAPLGAGAGPGDAAAAGILVFNEIGGAGVFTVDLSAADTIGDVVDLINTASAAAGASLSAELTAGGLTITPGVAELTITDTSGGAIAADFGILTNSPTSAPIVGQPLTARVTRLTPVAALNDGQGIDLQSGMIITNGSASAVVDLSAAETVQDIINTINNAGVYVLARINDAGNGIDVFNQVSGTSLSIGENGGTTAADLGLRTMDTATPLASLNFGAGVATREGEDDLRITAKDGSTVDVNLDGATTIADAIERINEAAAAANVGVTASFTEFGNGIRIVDSTGGAGPLSVTGLNASFAAADLGLATTVDDPATELIGRDINPTRTEGILGALVDLEAALRADDTQAIALAAERLDDFSPEVTRVHGIVGARSQAMRSTLQQVQDAARGTEAFLSEIRDLDYAEAATRMQQTLTQLQANYSTSSALFNLSLLDFLR